MFRYLIPCFLSFLVLPALQAQTDEEQQGSFSPPPIAELDRIVAVVNEGVITQSELDAKIPIVKQQLESQGTSIPPDDVLQSQILEQLIYQRLQLQMAESTGILVDDQTLNLALENIAGQNGLSLREFRSVLESDGFSFRAFREDIRDEIVISRLRQRQIDSRITVSDQEVNNFLATQNLQGASSDTEYQIAHILIAMPESSTSQQTQAAEQKARQMLSDIRAGADFEQTAVAVSDSQQALEGGNLGWRTAGQLPTIFAGIVPGMETGAVSDLIRSPSGLHIVKLIDRRGGIGQHIVEQSLVRHILVRPDELTSDQNAQERLQQLKQRIDGGEDFSAMARAHSDDTASAVNGGELGWVSAGDLTPRFAEVMSELDTGERSEPFQTQFGWHLVEVLDRRVHDDTNEFIRTQAREALHARKVEEEVQAWLSRLRDEAYVEYKLDEEQAESLTGIDSRLDNRS